MYWNVPREHTSNVRLLDTLLGEPFSEDVGHGLRWESDWEWVLGVVAGHGGDVLDVIG